MFLREYICVACLSLIPVKKVDYNFTSSYNDLYPLLSH